MRIFFISMAFLLGILSIIMLIKYQHLQRSLADGNEIIFATQHEQNKGLQKNTQELKKAKREIGKIRMELDKTQQELSSALEEIDRLHDELPDEIMESNKSEVNYRKIPTAYIPGINTVKKQTIDRPILFYGKDDVTANGTKTIILNDYLEYQHQNPCLLDCFIDLYVHTKTGVYSIKNPELYVDTQTVCGDVRTPVKWIRHDKIQKDFLFISSYKGSRDNSFVSPSKLKLNKWPTFIVETDIPLPMGYNLKKADLYQYNHADSYLIEVEALGWFISNNPSTYGPTRRIIWQGIYFADKSGIKLLTPEAYSEHVRLSENLQFSGLADVNGDNKLDIIIGKPVSIILERYQQKFRSWGFGLMPLIGCL